MEKVLSKADELANEIATLEEDDSENSDLKGILAQLRSAMSKRKSAGAGSTSTSEEIQDKPPEKEVFEVSVPVPAPGSL